MTTILAVAGRDTIHMFGDTAACDGNGKMIGMGQKINAHVSLPFAAGVMTDDVVTAAFIIKKLIRPAYKTVDELFSSLERVRRPWFIKPIPAIFVFAGITSKGPRMAMLATGPNPFGHTPWKLTPCDDLVILGQIEEREMKTLNVQMLVGAPQHMAPKWFQASRKVSPIGNSEFCGTGGHLQMITITQDGTNTKTLGYWPDMMGSPINPKRGFVPVAA